MKIIGRQIEFGVGLEEVRGTPETVAEKWVKKITATILEKSEKKSDESTRNVLSDSLGTRIIKKWIEGDLEGNLHVDAFGYYLLNIFGTVVSSNVAGAVYSHVFTLANNIQHPALTLFAKDGSVDQNTFSNGMIGVLGISASIDDRVKFNASFIAKAGASNSDTPSYDTEYDFIGRDITVKIADTEVGLVTADAIKLKELSINFDQGLISDHVFGSYNPDDIYNAKMMIEGDFMLNFDDTTFKDLYLADTYKYMEITIEGEADIGGGNKPSITILLNRTQIVEWEREDGADDLSTQPISFKAFYNETDAQQAKVTVQNLTSEYDTPLSI